MVVLVIVTEYPPMIRGAQLVANKGQIVADHLAAIALPNLFPDQSPTLGAANLRRFIHNLASARGPDHR
jgi:hypothetical protein